VLLFGLGSLMMRRFVWFRAAKSRSEGKFLVIADDRVGPVFHRDYASSGQYQQLRYVASQRELRGKPIAGEGTPTPVVEASHLLPHLDRESAVGYEAIVVAADLDRLAPTVLQRLGVINFEAMPVYSAAAFYAQYWRRLPLELIGPAWPLDAAFPLVQHSAYSAVKRVLDFLAALTALCLLSPLMLLVMGAILVGQGRPVFYSQTRVGLYRRPFTLYKFRTMKVGSDRGNSYTTEGDARITGLGLWLRRTRLDELPQLWNVLRGDMSLIGPRAEWARLVSDYEQRIAYYHFRHLVRPGITGWAQVNYPYGASLEDTLMKLSYDLYYIRNFSLRLDAEVVIKTLYVMLFGKGR
jgi:lipopolysaccharide/colanic/teichoic acid biosynthesis glycosyltransferase